MPLLLVLGGCGLEPPLSFDDLVIDELTFDDLVGDLHFQLDDGEDGSVEDLDYEMAVEGTPVTDGSGTEVDGGVVLAPVKLAYRDVFELGDLFHADDVIPFEVTAHYLFESAGVRLEYVLVQSGELPAPRAPVFVLSRLSDTTLAIEVVNENVEDVTVHLDGYAVEVDGEPVGAGDVAFGVVGDGGTATVELPLEGAGSGWGGRTVGVRLRSDAMVDTIFGPIPLAVDAVGDLASPR